VIPFQSLTKAELAELLLPLSRVKGSSALTPQEREKKARKQAEYRARQVFHWVYQRFVDDWDSMTDLSKELRAWLSANVYVVRLRESLSRQAIDGTHKFLWSLTDSKTIESVIIPAALREKGEAAFDPEPTTEPAEAEHPGSPTSTTSVYSGTRTEAELSGSSWARLTACVSSQVGCAMACKFCLTGVQGLDRSLETHEIVAQVHELRRRAPITNIVFMGMGEPLNNLQNLIRACRILLDQDGLAFSKRKVTVSTSGLVSGIDELGKSVDVSLAISLNASTDEQRDRIMPVNRRWNIEALLDACRRYPLGPHRRITFEYVLLKDFNDSLEDAARVHRLLRGIPSKVNLIPFNEHPGSEFRRPSDATVRAFQKYLLDRQMTATVRISRGRDILAACGQLRSIFGTARGTERHKDWAPPATAAVPPAASVLSGVLLTLGSALGLAALSAPGLATEAKAASELSATEIMESNDRAQRHRTVRAKARLETAGGKRRSSVKEFTWSRKLAEDGFRFLTRTEFHKPADIRGEVILFLEKGEKAEGQGTSDEGTRNEILIYLPAFRKVRRVETEQQSGSFMGSDFSYSDLTGIHVQDFKHKKLKEESCPGTKELRCWIIESEPAREEVRDRLGYASFRSWIRRSDFMAEQIEYRDLEGNPSKRLTLGDIRKVQGKKSGDRSFAHALEMRRLSGEMKDAVTKIDFESVEVEIDLGDALFSPQKLGR
jgi:23S rRNA (adenine2503-C2)-methyltransferase